MENLLNILKMEWHKLVSFFPRIILAIFVILISYVIGSYLATLLISALRRATERQLHEAFFRVAIILAIVLLGLVIALNILGLERIAVSIMAGGGVTAIVLGFAFREIGENFLAGLFLAFSRPFNVGDIIRTEDVEGEVRTIELRNTHIRTEDGRDIYVPSSQLFNKAVTNFTKDGLRRISFTVGIDYANDANKACSLLSEAARLTSGVLNHPPAGAYIFALLPQYVEIQVFFWIDMFNRSTPILKVRTDIMDNCRKILLENGYTVSSETITNIAIANKPSEK